MTNNSNEIICDGVYLNEDSRPTPNDMNSIISQVCKTYGNFSHNEEEDADRRGEEFWNAMVAASVDFPDDTVREFYNACVKWATK